MIETSIEVGTHKTRIIVAIPTEDLAGILAKRLPEEPLSFQNQKLKEMIALEHRVMIDELNALKQENIEMRAELGRLRLLERESYLREKALKKD